MAHLSGRLGNGSALYAEPITPYICGAPKPPGAPLSVEPARNIVSQISPICQALFRDKMHKNFSPDLC